MTKVYIEARPQEWELVSETEDTSAFTESKGRFYFGDITPDEAGRFALDAPVNTPAVAAVEAPVEAPVEPEAPVEAPVEEEAPVEAETPIETNDTPTETP